MSDRGLCGRVTADTRSDVGRSLDDGTFQDRAGETRDWWLARGGGRSSHAASAIGAVPHRFWPSRRHGIDTLAGPGGADQTIQVWWMAWAEHALAHGQNPFFSNWINYPVGINFGPNGSMLATRDSRVTDHGRLRTRGLMECPRSPDIVRFGLRDVPLSSGAGRGGGLRPSREACSTASASTRPRRQAATCSSPSCRCPPLIYLVLYEGLVRQQWRPARAGVLLAVLCRHSSWCRRRSSRARCCSGSLRLCSTCWPSGGPSPLDGPTQDVRHVDHRRRCDPAGGASGLRALRPAGGERSSELGRQAVPWRPARLDCADSLPTVHHSRAHVLQYATLRLVGEFVPRAAVRSGCCGHRVLVAQARHRGAGGRHDGYLVSPVARLDPLCRRATTPMCRCPTSSWRICLCSRVWTRHAWSSSRVSSVGRSWPSGLTRPTDAGETIARPWALPSRGESGSQVWLSS